MAEETSQEVPQEPAQDTMFQDAVNALREGNRTRAKDVLTRLIKADQSNATYWVWLSAAVDTNKERIYCLQAALKLDPENASAKRGLVLLGAIPPDENIQPFPLNHARAWEEKLLLTSEQNQKKSTSNPVGRLAEIVVGIVIVIGLAIGGLFFFPRQNTNSFFKIFDTNTPGASPTFTLTPTLIGATPLAITPSAGPNSLAATLGVSYSPTPLYVNTPRAPQSSDQYNVALAAYEKGDWTTYIANMQQIEELEPNAADVPYDIGEAYRFQGDYKDALDAYTASLKINPNFAPAYLGMARVNLAENPGADITTMLNTAIQDDPNYGEAYLARAEYYLTQNKFDLALNDLDSADKHLPNSAQVQYDYARVYLAQGNTAEGLAAAQRANQIDLTMLPDYLLLGQAYVANDQFSDAIQPLETYTTYAPGDANAYAWLGQSYEQMGKYPDAIAMLSKSISLNPNQHQAYLYRGLAELELNNVSAADTDVRRVIEFFPNSFDANLGLIRISYLEDHYGDAFLHLDSTSALAKTDGQKASLLYWTALIQEKRGNNKAAITAWTALLAMSPDVMTQQMYDDATQHLAVLTTATPPTETSTPTATPTITPTPSSTPTPTNLPPTKKP
jgi:tetratricopeptide (TPR) repeat protein